MRIQKEPARWRVSSRSQNGSNCVEVALADAVAVRDTKDRDGGQLAVTGRSWTAFVTKVATQQ